MRDTDGINTVICLDTLVTEHLYLPVSVTGDVKHKSIDEVGCLHQSSERISFDT
jgi:hypothetical protein